MATVDKLCEHFMRVTTNSGYPLGKYARVNPNPIRAA